MSDRYIETILEKVASNGISEEDAYDLIKEYQTLIKKNQIDNMKSKGSKDIAIIGVACRLPSADTKEEFWENLVNGVDCIREFPAQRLELLGMETPCDGSSFMNAGYLDSIDTFDAGFFNIPPGEAKYIDPQQRLFMKTAYEAIEDAGYSWDSISNTNTGIYVGYSDNKYGDLINNSTPSAFVGNFPAVMPSRLSYLFNLSGPSISIATACSSSLVALHMACKGIEIEDCDMALAGGVVLTIHPGKKDRGGIGITSCDGRSKAFDAAADGTGWGEGSGVVLLKELNKAIRDNDNIYAVIKGSAINQDGASNEISSPKASAQTDVLVKAWEKAEIDPLTISYIETHGTGTKIGDPIEIKGITDAFAKYTNRKQFCPIGSVKSNIGHLDSASGIVGLIKVVMLLNQKQIPPSLHFNTPNPLISFTTSSVYVNKKLSMIENNEKPLRASVSSFGLSGTNCHVVVEEFNMKRKTEEVNDNKFIFTLSAKTEKSLKLLIGKYIKYFEKNNELNLSEICYTVNTGRGHYNYRMAIVVSNYNELVEKLKRVLLCESLDECNNGGIYYASIEKPGENKFKYKLMGNNSDIIETIAEKYLSGEKIDWNELYRNKKILKVPLPTYAFDEKRYWIESEIGQADLNNINNERDLEKVILKGKNNDKDYVEEEKRLGLVWSEILGLKEININDNFFELGGDSLLASEITVELSKRYNYIVNLKDIFDNTTISELASCISRQEEGNYDVIKPLRKSDYYPMSATQVRQYVLSQISNESTSYNMPVIMIIEGELKISQFKKTLEMLIARHESLRTSFELIDDEVLQKVHDSVDVEIEYENGNLEEIDNIIHNFIRPFDLSIAPLVRVKLMKIVDNGVSSGKYIFLFDMHHIISDGVSMEIIVREFTELYQGSSLAEIKIHYKDYAVWHNNFLKGESIRKQKDYWKSQFIDWITDNRVTVLEMPTDYERPATPVFEGDVEKFPINVDMADKMRKFSLDNGVTLYMLLLAAYNVILNEYTNQEEVVVGSLIAGRNQPDLKNIVGVFTNYLPIRSYPKNNETFINFLADIKKNMLKAFENQDVPFQDIVDMIIQKSESNRNPIFDTMVVLHNQAQRLSEIKMGNITLKTFDWKRQSSTLDFKLDVFEELDGSLHCYIEYSKMLFKKESISEFARNFTKLLHLILRDPYKKISELKVLTDEERILLNAKRRKTKYLKSMQEECIVSDNTHVNDKTKSEVNEAGSSLRKRPNLANPYIAPESDLEKLIVDVCRDVLKVEQVGIYDNFFDLGGNSLMAVKCISKINKLLNISLPGVSLFQGPTVSSLVELLNDQEDQQNKDVVLEIEKRESELIKSRELQKNRRRIRQREEE